MERLQKVIANSGLVSRRKAEELILSGAVRVNGEIVTVLGIQVSPSDEITVSGKMIARNVQKEYILLHKPRGYVTTTKDDKDRKTVLDLVPSEKRIYPVGRLDYDTTGALLLTNDGELSHLLMHPSSSVDKVYIAKIEGELTKAGILALRQGVSIDGQKTSPAKVKIISINKKTHHVIVEIVIHEGRNHQVKKMFEAIGCHVIKLKREKIAFLDIKELPVGTYRYLNPKEVKKLYAVTMKRE